MGKPPTTSYLQQRFNDYSSIRFVFKPNQIVILFYFSLSLFSNIKSELIHSTANGLNLWPKLISRNLWDPFGIACDSSENRWNWKSSAAAILVHKAQNSNECAGSIFIDVQWCAGIALASTLSYVNTQWTNHIVGN